MDFAASFDSSLPRRRLRVLCAEDHAQMADLIRLVLERAGYEVVCVPDGRQAWDLVRADPLAFDAVVTDHQMPEMNGFQLVRKLRGIKFAGKIVVQSAHLTLAEERAYLALGVDRILHKPSGLFDLVAII